MRARAVPEGRRIGIRVLVPRATGRPRRADHSGRDGRPRGRPRPARLPRDRPLRRLLRATAAQVFLRRHARSGRSVVLDGATLLDVPIFERLASNGQRALDLLARRCAADRRCSRAFPTWRADHAALLGRLDRRPVAVRRRRAEGDAERSRRRRCDPVVPGAGHTNGHVGCLPEVIERFVGRAGVSDLDLSCVRRMQLPGWVF